jgi:hypothetical protein
MPAPVRGACVGVRIAHNCTITLTFSFPSLQFCNQVTFFSNVDYYTLSQLAQEIIYMVHRCRDWSYLILIPWLVQSQELHSLNSSRSWIIDLINNQLNPINRIRSPSQTLEQHSDYDLPCTSQWVPTCWMWPKNCNWHFTTDYCMYAAQTRKSLSTMHYSWMVGFISPHPPHPNSCRCIGAKHWHANCTCNLVKYWNLLLLQQLHWQTNSPDQGNPNQIKRSHSHLQP